MKSLLSSSSRSCILYTKFYFISKGPHPRQRFSIATAMCSQIAVAVAVDGLPTHAATDLFSDSNNIVPLL